jgi:hypothetical protein
MDKNRKGLCNENRQMIPHKLISVIPILFLYLSLLYFKLFAAVNDTY